MEALRLILLFVHILGFAALLGGLIVQWPSAEKKVNHAMRDGAGTAFLAGILLVAVLSIGDWSVNYPKIGVKLGIGLVILVLVMANLSKPKLSDAMYYLIMMLTVVNIGVAVFWSSVHR